MMKISPFTTARAPLLPGFKSEANQQVMRKKVFQLRLNVIIFIKTNKTTTKLCTFSDVVVVK